ncbi:SEFIR domain-containing protein [Nostoc sp. ChiQUE01b]|uniref:SEFIR domain-containing protein n=1 Tax=Nostoc sp. ChiQUE01b TaxID=3075376 RepID=UPI002AD2FE25|nr:SEFIR domain-containing protein [Nostoc sp. ChiQUE01b]MDZ8260991.1 SEFIR domain-containing protein [Nostoc sp. ChiQUE01b]
MNSVSNAPKVFISYSHDSQEHRDKVLDLANRLRAEGVDCNIDQYEESSSEGWPRWMMNQLEWADFIVVVCTEQYDRRFRGREELGIGRGVTWEGAIITQELYDSHAKSTKFVPIILSSTDGNFIPIMIRGFSRYDLYTEEGYQAFYRRLTNQPLNLKPPLGKKVELAPRVLPALPPRERKQTFDYQNTLNQQKSGTRVVVPEVSQNSNVTPETKTKNNKVIITRQLALFIGIITFVSSLLIFPFLKNPFLFYDSNQDFNQDSNQNYKVSIEYPPNWQARKGDPIKGEIAKFVSEKENQFDTFQEYVLISIDTPESPKTLDEYTQKTVNQISHELTKDIISPHPVLLAGKEARQIIYTEKSQGQSYKKKQIWTLNNDKFYVITYVAKQDKFSQFEPKVQHMINSFKID